MRAPTLFAKPRFAAAGAAAALALVASQPAVADEPEAEDAVEMTKGEKKLAKILEGRVAGEPQNCIRTRLNNRLRVIDETAYVYGSGRTIYVQRTKNPEDIDRDDVLIQRRFSASQLCKLDIVTKAERAGGIFTGVVFFDEFIPYTRVENLENDG
ncbi:hypothetical protein [Erythrobacter sp. THAF29]|uniref:hypothetical protein n=1 Tax=Erythrobacter sp. THAF29 TaxID=2587851 RepID=UPI0012680108|nr:hypothetical protein [Erythrobacter sp. THAF29]QFT76627.1 hypothetical protein FIU90_03620 [Erythrobacter sp. THAF29]